MQYFVGLDQMEARAKAIGLSLGRLARMAGVDPATVYRGRKGETDMRTSNARALFETLERQEERVRAHLRELERNGGKAA